MQGQYRAKLDTISRKLSDIDFTLQAILFVISLILGALIAQLFT